MELLDTLKVYHAREERLIEIYQGDLTALKSEEAVDVIVVSAFPNDYAPQAGTLIGALQKKGISVSKLARDKAVDLRESYSCWISRPVTAENPGIQFKRILCFEPLTQEKPPRVVGDIFQSLVAFSSEDTSINSVAMPIVAAGSQGVAISHMFQPLIEAAVHWLAIGLPLKKLKIVAYTKAEAEEIQRIFPGLKAKYASLPLENSSEFKYDIFISYSHKDGKEASFLVDQLQKERPDLRIFLDHKELNAGTAWQQEIFEALDSCRKIMTMYSLSYMASKVCKEEFNIALYRDRDSDEGILFPIYLYSANLPTYMKVLQYIDCREADEVKLKEACKVIVAALDKKSSAKKASNANIENTKNEMKNDVSALTEKIENMQSKINKGNERMIRLESKVDILLEKVEQLATTRNYNVHGNLDQKI